MSDWAGVFIFFTVALVFGAGGILTSFLIQPRRANPVKMEEYECGVPTIGPTWVQFRTSYFLYALLFQDLPERSAKSRQIGYGRQLRVQSD